MIIKSKRENAYINITTQKEFTLHIRQENDKFLIVYNQSIILDEYSSLENAENALHTILRFIYMDEKGVIATPEDGDCFLSIDGINQSYGLNIEKRLNKLKIDDLFITKNGELIIAINEDSNISRQETLYKLQKFNSFTD